MIEQKVWTLVKRPKNRQVLKNKLVFSVKSDADGFVDRFKIRIVACGYDQIEGIDYDFKYSPTLSQASLKLLLIIAQILSLFVWSIDIKTAYLYGDLDKEVYMELPNEFRTDNDFVCKLRKSIYGLKQSGEKSIK